MIALYALGLFYKLRHGASEHIGEEADDEERARWSLRQSLIILALTTALCLIAARHLMPREAGARSA